VRIPVRVRYENTLDDLTARYRINSGSKIGAFTCKPEHIIPPNGAVTRTDEIVIAATLLDRGTCSQVEYVVSNAFVDCTKHPDAFDVTTGDDDELLGRAMFWIWETSTDPLTNGMAARALIDTCPTIPYSEPTTPPPSMGTTP
jgi:hypothetical protein